MESSSIGGSVVESALEAEEFFDAFPAGVGFEPGSHPATMSSTATIAPERKAVDRSRTNRGLRAVLFIGGILAFPSIRIVMRRSYSLIGSFTSWTKCCERLDADNSVAFLSAALRSA